MKRFLIIKPSSFGDVIHALPVAVGIARQVPGAEIDWVVRPEYAELLQGHPDIRKVFLFDRKKWSKWSRVLRTLPEGLALIQSFRREKYDAVLDLQGLFRSGLMTYLSGSPLRFGFENAREGSSIFYNRKVRVPTIQMHAIERYQLFLKEIGIHAVDLDYNLRISPTASVLVQDLLAGEGVRNGRPLIVINPNARWETKRWFPDLFAELAERFVRELEAEVLLVGAKSEVEETGRIQAQTKSAVHNLAGKTTIMQLAALLSRADLMVTCDSGPMHLSASVGTPVVALFGPTDPVRTGPFGAGHGIIKKTTDCEPCLKRTCPQGVRLCMESISVDDVFQEAKRLLSASAPPAERDAFL